ncbi:MAG: serine/threonine-protein phosphatase, partial [Cyanobacteria bacterium NC_groundwater_1444_Ag_S-0.65um_54_12]|nr:serine/threonine-protein phosphatase [Cyanobacteria bacterium NC_groundwater_1444_Ag_S-0.65um_54_12]
EFVHAGAHIDLVVYRKKLGYCTRIPTIGVFAGISDDIADVIQNSYFNIDPGDILFLLTDGIIEAVNTAGNMLEYEGLMAIILANVAKSVNEICDAVVSETIKWSMPARLRDDVSIVVIKRKDLENS